MFIDRAKIHVKAGAGGNGCTSFYKDRSVRKGKPTGGDGGNGGSIIFKADKAIHTLLDFQYTRHFKADRGAHGGSNDKKGKDGGDSTIKIPPGTIIKDAASGLLLRDLSHEGEEVVVARGGFGGKGNTKKGDGTPGAPGEEKELALELKLIADIGVIGYPNAGKSTFLSHVSKARSKIANYPFTTKAPILGVVEINEELYVFADMPGLIKGAHSGRGLGDEFLRHIERTKILLHLVDVAGVDQRDPYADYLSINEELELYGRRVSKKPQIVACNKMDLLEGQENFKEFEKKVGKKVFPISALTGAGIKELLDEIGKVQKNSN